MSEARRTRIAVPARVTAGETVEIRTLIQHPMESGFRRDSVGRPIPRNILTRFECRLDDELIFAATLAPGTAANPFIAFSLRVTRGGTLRMTWTDQHGETTKASEPLVVV